MIELAVWCGFIGSWLLVTGSVYQAATELNDVNVAAGRDHASREDLFSLAPPPPPISPWWWLIPPVGYALNAVRSSRYRETIMKRMDPTALRQMVTFGQKATGWLLVALGAFAIAVKETAEFAEHYELHVLAFVVLIVIFPLLAFSFTVFNLRRFERYLGLQKSSDTSTRESAED